MTNEEISEYLDYRYSDPEDLGALLFSIRDRSSFDDDHELREMVEKTGLGGSGFQIGLLLIALHIGCKLAER